MPSENSASPLGLTVCLFRDIVVANGAAAIRVGSTRWCFRILLTRACAIAGCAAASFNHLIRLRLQRKRDSEVKGFRGLKVDHELELGRLHHWKVRRRSALQNTPSVDAGLPVRCGDARSIADQAA